MTLRFLKYSTCPLMGSPISRRSSCQTKQSGHTQLPTHSFSNAASWVPQLAWATGASLIGSEMLLRSRHWKKPSRASQQRARCNRLGAIPSPDDEEEDEDPKPSHPIVCLEDGLKRIVLLVEKEHDVLRNGLRYTCETLHVGGIYMEIPMQSWYLI